MQQTPMTRFVIAMSISVLGCAAPGQVAGTSFARTRYVPSGNG